MSFGIFTIIDQLIDYHSRDRSIIHRACYNEHWTIRFHEDFVRVLDPIHEHHDHWDDDHELELFDLYELIGECPCFGIREKKITLKAALRRWYVNLIYDIQKHDHVDKFPILTKEDAIEWRREGDKMHYSWLIAAAA